MKNNELFSEDNAATYCPEDDKLRLYVGRVPRPEYEALRAEGWTSTPKQDCDFVAVWTPQREDTALSYAGIIEDEDAGPEERAADRAERFSGYLDKRLDEAGAHADRFDAGPSVHGYQSQARSIRSADRHDKIASRAVNAWDKADYWQRRTAGVISHALYKSRPDVRMGRIKTLEAELRKAEKSWTESIARAQARFDAVQSVIEHAEGTREKVAPSDMADFRWEFSRMREAAGIPDDEKAPVELIRRAVLVSEFSGWRNNNDEKRLAAQAKAGERPASEIAREWIANRTRPADFDPEKGSRGTRHLRLRLAYEWQMLEAQGGRAALVEMEKGGTVGGKVIAKINKSPKTKRVVSVLVVTLTHGTDRWGNDDPKAPKYRLEQIDTERLGPNAYKEPTEESRSLLSAYESELKSYNAKKPKAPVLINPTLKDAQRLQDMLNAAYLSEWTRQHGMASQYYKPKDPAEVCQITQAQYSAASKGAYARAETRGLCGNGVIEPAFSNMWSSAAEARKKARGPAICKIRITGYEPARVIHITDKPAKPLPAAVWEPYAPPAENTPEKAEA